MVPALFVTLLAGCNSSEDDAPRAESPEPEAATVAATPSSAEASPVAESTGPPPTTGPVHHLGDRVRLATGSKMTVISWQPAQRPGPPAAGAWWAADVEFCLTRTFGDNFEEPVGNIRSQLRAELADGRALTPEDDARKPDEVYSKDIPVVAGKCLRGKVVFDVPTGGAATYFSATLSEFGWVRWQLS